ncbi:MAG: polymerase subunit gamma/tau [Chthoniobacter sp.]|nr:polymerase subunit gamma/tau [Chthoniobacter sp.]
MSYTVFARKYRPQTFDEIVGQDHIVQTLRNAIEQNRLAQAYLFVGPRGTGKTSTARIFAKALNCVNGPTTNPCGVCDMCKEIAAGNSLNVLEFDAASNTQVDKIREIIIDTVKYAPSHGKYKLYIVDEVHMLSTSSFNALLKTLEEPPAHVKFVFATTDVQKVPTTIISRCQRFDLRRISVPEIARHLLFIAGQEKITLAPVAAETIARGAEGGLRDAESMLDQLVAFCGNQIEEADVLNIFGFTSAQTTTTLVDHLIAGETAPALAVLHEQAEAGKDLSRLMSDLIAHLRNLLVIQCDPDGVKDELGAEAIAALAEQSGRIAQEKLLELIEQFAGAEARMKWAPNKKMHFEIATIRAIQSLKQATLTEVLEALTALRSGEPVPDKPARSAAVSSPPAPRAARAVAPAPAPTPAPGPTPAPAPEARRSLSEAVAAEIGATKAASPVPVATPAPAAKVREEPVAPSSPAPSVSATEVWPQLVARVRKERPLIKEWLEAGQLTEIQDDTAIFSFPTDSGLARESCERGNNRKFLEATLTEIAGRPLTLKCLQIAGLTVERIAPSEPERVPDPTAAFRDDPLIKKALAEFKAEIIPA